MVDIYSATRQRHWILAFAGMTGGFEAVGYLSGGLSAFVVIPAKSFSTAAGWSSWKRFSTAHAGHLAPLLLITCRKCRKTGTHTASGRLVDLAGKRAESIALTGTKVLPPAAVSPDKSSCIRTTIAVGRRSLA